MVVIENNYQMLATTLFGLENVLAQELRILGAQQVNVGNRSVTFVGDKGFMYKANLALRTAIRILMPIRSFTVRDEAELYDKIKKIHWLKYLDNQKTFAVKAIVNSKNFTTNTHYISLKTKDAIADFFREKFGTRPDIDVKHPDILIHIHIDHQTCHVSIDSSGESLHKRGYRERTNLAPINEVLAAGMLLLSGYNGSTPLIDPMCGSGTILIEAAMIAANIPACIHRNEFGFEKWNDFDIDLFETIHQSLVKKIKNPNYKIIGYDKAPSAVIKAEENIKNADLQDFIEVHQQNFFESHKPDDVPTMLVFNPPYGERLQSNDIQLFYQQIGDTLKHHYTGCTAWFISSDFEALKNVGLRTSKKIPLKNGDLDCKLVQYELYDGSKKVAKF